MRKREREYTHSLTQTWRQVPLFPVAMILVPNSTPIVCVESFLTATVTEQQRAVSVEGAGSLASRQANKSTYTCPR